MDKKYRKVESLGSLLPKVTKSMGIEFRMKEMIIMNYWHEIARGPAGKNSKPYNITRGKKGLILYVAAKSATVAQELTMLKMVLLDKLNMLASQVGLTINDIVVSPKYWEETCNNHEIYPVQQDQPQRSKELNNVDIDSIALTDEQKKLIEASLQPLNIDDEVKNTLKLVMYRDMKLKNYKEQKGYPACKKCGVFLNKFEESFCPVCKFH